MSIQTDSNQSRHSVDILFQVIHTGGGEGGSSGQVAQVDSKHVKDTSRIAQNIEEKIDPPYRDISSANGQNPYEVQVEKTDSSPVSRDIRENYPPTIPGGKNKTHSQTTRTTESETTSQFEQEIKIKILKKNKFLTILSNPITSLRAKFFENKGSKGSSNSALEERINKIINHITLKKQILLLKLWPKDEPKESILSHFTPEELQKLKDIASSNTEKGAFRTMKQIRNDLEEGLIPQLRTPESYHNQKDRKTLNEIAESI